MGRASRAGRLLRTVIFRTEFWILAALGLLAGGVYTFVELADEVAEGESDRFDEALLLLLRNPADLQDPIGPWWVEVFFEDFTRLGSTTVLTSITIVAVGYLLVEQKRAAAILTLVSVAGGALTSNLLKYAFARPRPDLVAHLVEVQSLSFPSGHAMNSAVTFLTLGALLARFESRVRTRGFIISVAIALTVLVGISRVYLGVHYPTDVLAGWSAGAAWAMLCWLVALWLQQRSTVDRA